MMATESRPWFLLALLVGLGWLLYRLAPVVTPFAISAALAYLGDPLVDRLERFRLWRWPIGRTTAVVVVFALMTAALALVLLILVPLLRDQVKHLAERAPQMLEWLLGTAVPWLQERLGLDAIEFDPHSLVEAARSYWKEAGAALLSVLGTVSRGGQAVLNLLMNLVLIPVVTFYLLRDWDRLVAGIRALLPRRSEPVVSDLFREVDEVLGAFIRGQLLVMMALGLVYALGLWLVGLDLAFLIGLGAGLLSVVPYLGTFAGLAAALVAAMFQFGDLLHAVLALAVFGVGQSLEGMVLTPKLVGDRIGLHPVAVIFAVLAGGQLFGFLGVLLALPVAAVLNVLVRHLNDRYLRSAAYGADSGKAGDA